MTALRLSAGTLALEPFSQRATRELYVIRNHPTVRPHMASPALIAYKAHVAWTSENLLVPGNLHLWMVRTALVARAIGFTQLRMNVAPDTAEIGVVFREPESHRLPAGLSSALTLYIAFERLGCEWVTSYVIPTHAAALKYNQAWGLTIVNSDKPGMVQLKLGREACLANANYRKVMSRLRRSMSVTGS